MPVLLKNKTNNSPGIVVFTHNEILRGVPRKSLKVNNLLTKACENNEWIFGVHVQGDCSNVYNWPYKDWQNFFLWPEKNDHFLSKIPKSNISELTCVNFLSEKINLFNKIKKDIDIISVSRFSSIKKIYLTLKIFKGLLDKDPNYKFVLLALRAEKKFHFFFENKKEAKYLKQVDRLINDIKKSEKYKNLKIIDPVIKEDDLFPIPEENIYEYTSRSKYQMLNSNREGVPRVLIESLYLNTKVIISNQLKFGLKKFLNNINSFVYDEKKGTEKIIEDIHKKLKEPIDYSKSFIEKEKFEEKKNKKLLVNFFDNLDLKKNFSLEDINHPSWKLDNLKFRLCSHFKERSHQIIKNEKLFLNWFKNLNEDTNYNDEKYSFLFKKDNLDLILEIKFFFKKLQKFLLRKININ